MPDKLILVGFADGCDRYNRNQRAPEKVKVCLNHQNPKIIVLIKRQKIEPVNFNVYGLTIEVIRTIKNLGLWLDTKLTFMKYTNKTAQKSEKTTKAITSLIPGRSK